jgi:predicted metal-dependent hydrolase
MLPESEIVFRMLLAGTQVIQYGDTAIEYELVYTQRKTLAIHVYPDGSIIVKAPAGTEMVAVENIVKKRAAWILRQQRKFEMYLVAAPLPRQYVSGEAYRYLGRQYRLKVVEDTVERVRLNRGYIFVSVVNPSDKQCIQHLLDHWYISHARRIFSERLAVCFPRLEHLGIAYPKLAIRNMKSRWGSCSGKGKITLNVRLIQTPRDCIDYVILHELCHLKEPNHSPQFYALLNRVLPNWRELRQKLNEFELT